MQKEISKLVFSKVVSTLKEIKQELREGRGRRVRAPESGIREGSWSPRGWKQAALQRAVGRALEAEGTVSAKALRQAQAWLVPKNRKAMGAATGKAKEFLFSSFPVFHIDLLH